MMKKKSWRIFRVIWFSLVLIFFIWNWTTFQSHNLPKDILLNSNLVSVVETAEQITFRSDTSKIKLQVIFFQGGLADPKAYTPLCRKLAESGFTCHLIKMPWRLPQYYYHKISQIFDLTKGNFVIGGHSQGGKMAAQFVCENPKVLKGLFLMGTSHPRDVDLSAQSISCIKLYAENDGLADVDEVLANKNKLPKDTKLVLIKGGNHSQFGYLGKLLMDNSATITMEEQQQQMLHHLINFLNAIKKDV